MVHVCVSVVSPLLPGTIIVSCLRRTTLPPVAVRLCHIFSTLSHKTARFSVKKNFIIIIIIMFRKD
jgi:hypothetical protein